MFILNKIMILIGPKSQPLFGLSMLLALSVQMIGKNVKKMIEKA